MPNNLEAFPSIDLAFIEMSLDYTEEGKKYRYNWPVYYIPQGKYDIPSCIEKINYQLKYWRM